LIVAIFQLLLYVHPIREQSSAESSGKIHKYQQKFALGLHDDSIYLYDFNIEDWMPFALRHEFQTNIQCLEWKPQSGNTLAAGCSHGILIWFLLTDTHRFSSNGNSMNQKIEPTPWASYLRSPGHEPVTSLAWHPAGTHLATGSIKDNAIMIWDTTLGICTPIRRFGNISILKWSPSGHYLFSSTTKSILRIWETRTWTCEKWNFNQNCKSACWSPDSSLLLFSIEGQTTINSIRFRIDRSPPYIGGQFYRSDDIGRFPVRTQDGTVTFVGGVINQIEWDPTGERLAVTFLGNEENEDLIAVFAPLISPAIFELNPRGFIRGPTNGGKAHIMSFRPQFPRGALLANVS